jgi:hypothetical protein
MNVTRTHLLQPVVLGARDDSIGDVVLVALQHLLPSIQQLFSRTLQWGFKAHNIWLLGKPYSTIASTERWLREQMRLNVYHTPAPELFSPGEYDISIREYARDFWKNLMAQIGSQRNVILLDEGGLLRKTIPPEFLEHKHNIVAIEHTSSGWNCDEALRYPVILKARSYAKLRYESPFIAEALIDRLLLELNPGLTKELAREQDLPLPHLRRVGQRALADKRVGIIGFGFLGRSLTRYLKGIGTEHISAWDRSDGAFSGTESRFVERSNLTDLINRNEIIFGCTGNTVENVRAALTLNSNSRSFSAQPDTRRSLKIFCSCSSADREFLELIPYLAQVDRKFARNPFENAAGLIGDCSVQLINGGFPINFDRRREYEPRNRIWLTRELTFASILQALQMLTAGDLSPRPVMLDPILQREIVGNWVKHLLAESDSLAEVPDTPPHDLDVWLEGSEGTPTTFMTDFVGTAGHIRP